MSAISKEILIYHSLPHSKYRWISYFSLVHMGVVTFNLFFLVTPTLMEERDEVMKSKNKSQIKPDETTTESENNRWDCVQRDKPDTFWTRIENTFRRDIFTWTNLKNNLAERPLASALLIGSTGFVLGSFTFYARRMLHRIVLLPNDRVRFQFFNPFPFGKPSTLELGLHDVSCNAGRRSNHNYSTLRIRNRWGYFLVHKAEGEFLEPKLYDKYLGYERSWAVKN